jgi:hypothetical protein
MLVGLEPTVTPAEPPTNFRSPEASASTITLRWEPGITNECFFESWEIEAFRCLGGKGAVCDPVIDAGGKALPLPIAFTVGDY